MSTHSINLLDVTPRASTWRLWLLRFWVIGSVLATSFCVFKGLEASVPRPTTRQITVTEEVRRTKRMDEVRENDVVLARDEHGTEIGPRRVTQIFRRESDHLRLLTFEARDGTRQVIETTDEHPFACADSLDFIPAGQLPIGHQVPGPKGERQTLVASTREAHPEGIPVFNFEVEGFHTYFVSSQSRSQSLLVHNRCDYDVVRDPRTTAGYNPGDVHIDHILARALGGPDTDDNLRAVTAALNLRKGGLEGELAEYLQYLMANGMDEKQAFQVIQAELDALARDALPTPFSSLPGLVLPE